MKFNPIAWFQRSPGEAAVAVEFAAKEVAQVEAEAPAKAVSVVHALLLEIEAHEGNHPLLRALTVHIDQMIEANGPAFLDKLERAVIAALAVKYPLFELVLHPKPADTTPAASATAPATPAASSAA